MSAPTDPLVLAADFPPASEDDWRALVRGVLRRSGLPDDADPVEALSATTYEGIRIRPLYTSGPDAGLPGTAPFVRGANADGATVRGWDVRTRHRNPDPSATHDAVLNDLETGATSLWLALGDGGIAVSDLATVLDGVYLDLAPIVLDAGDRTEEAARALLGLLRDVDPAQVRGSLGADPIGWHARTGAGADLDGLGGLAELAGGHPNLCVATVDATVYHDAGASDAAELAISASVGVAYLRALTDAGLSVDDALAALEFRYAVTAEQFTSIAKLRAARQVWGRVAELCSATAGGRGQRQHAVTSAAMMTRRDPWVNMLRTTIACFAAAVGGADSVTVLPFDAAIGLPDDFARRIARNTHAVLHDESGLGRVVDAAGGSWYVETLTAELAAKAWDEFTALERDGGVLTALDEGRIDALLATTREARADDIAHRRAPLTGVTEFALPGEPALDRVAAPPGPSGGPLTARRWAQDFEELRDQVEAAQPRPAVYLATLGPPAAHSARLGFALNLFNAGGFAVRQGDPSGYAPDDARVVCLCSSDPVYADEAADAARALREAGAQHVWLAGEAETDGVDGYLFAGCDALAVLRTAAEVATS